MSQQLALAAKTPMDPNANGILGSIKHSIGCAVKQEDYPTTFSIGAASS